MAKLTQRTHRRHQPIRQQPTITTIIVAITTTTMSSLAHRPQHRHERRNQRKLDYFLGEKQIKIIVFSVIRNKQAKTNKQTTK